MFFFRCEIFRPEKPQIDGNNPKMWNLKCKTKKDDYHKMKLTVLQIFGCVSFHGLIIGLILISDFHLFHGFIWPLPFKYLLILTIMPYIILFNIPKLNTCPSAENCPARWFISLLTVGLLEIPNILVTWKLSILT